MASDKALANTESESRTFTALGSKERLENVGKNIGGDAITGVSNLEFDDVARRLHGCADVDTADRPGWLERRSTADSSALARADSRLP
jgi:hypothetical protein